MPETLNNPRHKRPKNPTWRPRCDGLRWNVSHIAQATGFHRDTVRRKLHDAGVAPCGHVSNSPVYELPVALAAVYGKTAPTGDPNE